MTQIPTTHISFSALPDEKKEELFFSALQLIGELMECEECYEIFHDDFDLSDEEIWEHSLMNDAELMAMGAAISNPREKVLNLHHVIRKSNEDTASGIYVVHVDGGDAVPLDFFWSRGAYEHKDYEAIIGAHIIASRHCDGGTALVINGVNPQQLTAFMDAQQNKTIIESQGMRML